MVLMTTTPSQTTKTITVYEQDNKVVNFEDLDPSEDWWRKVYDENGKLVYIENRDGYWEKSPSFKGYIEDDKSY